MWLKGVSNSHKKEVADRNMLRAIKFKYLAPGLIVIEMLLISNNIISY